MTDTQHQQVETPFEYRHCCWFCGEPANTHFSFPQAKNYVVEHQHPPLSIQCCSECLIPAQKSKARSIWAVSIDVKKCLLKTYRKHLAIGVNWTKEELENSGFESGNFASFRESGWMMYEIAKQRVNYAGWPLVVGGISIEELKWQESSGFAFDGVNYPSVNDAIWHYSTIFDLHKEFFTEVVHKLGQENFAQAVRFCRLLVGSTPYERQTAIKNL